MSRMRVIFDNAAYRATLAASSAAGTRTVDRLLTNMKTDVWRATGTAATLTLTWPTPEIIGGVALPFCNITSAATIRARGYTLPDDASPAVDSGVILAAPPAPLDGGWWGVEALAPNIYRRDRPACRSSRLPVGRRDCLCRGRSSTHDGTDRLAAGRDRESARDPRRTWHFLRADQATRHPALMKG